MAFCGPGPVMSSGAGSKAQSPEVGDFIKFQSTDRLFKMATFVAGIGFITGFDTAAN